MKNYIIKPLVSLPGIQRDGTAFMSQHYIDGQWVRFYMGRPLKIGGYKLIDIGNNQTISSMFPVFKTQSVDVYLGRESSLQYTNIDFNFNTASEVNRTPSVGDGFEASAQNLWSMDQFSTTLTGIKKYIVASPMQNRFDLNNSTNSPLFYGDVNTTTPLAPILDSGSNPVAASGGVIFAPPYMVAYGNDGVIQWSEAGDITAWPATGNSAVIANNKIVYMALVRPQLIAWTINSILSVSYTTIADVTTFVGNTIQENISVMSTKCIVPYQQQFFWPGIDQFYFFNGTVQTLTNTMSTDWFFKNINFEYRNLVWGMVVGINREIWWFYPRGTSTVCNAVIIYNLELNVWYDSFISRAAGLSANLLTKPIMSDSEILPVPPGRGAHPGFGLWVHEYGVDQQIGEQKFAINSFFESSIFTLFQSNPENNRLVRVRRIEPDFVQTGKMAVTINNRMFPSDTLENGGIIQTGPFEFIPETDKVDDINSQGRLPSVVFSSNEAGGDYQTGQPLLDYEVGDIQP